jgi:DNA repair protein RadC
MTHQDNLGEIACHLIGRHDREHLLALYINSHAHIVGVSIVSIGHVSGMTSTPKEVLRAGVILGAPAFALAHNHPSGNLIPSDEDVAFTRAVSAGSKALGMVMLDHVIVHFDRYRSMENECPECCVGVE